MSSLINKAAKHPASRQVYFSLMHLWVWFYLFIYFFHLHLSFAQSAALNQPEQTVQITRCRWYVETTREEKLLLTFVLTESDQEHTGNDGMIHDGTVTFHSLPYRPETPFKICWNFTLSVLMSMRFGPANQC